MRRLPRQSSSAKRCLDLGLHGLYSERIVHAPAVDFQKTVALTRASLAHRTARR